jgi:hypothetical protein
MIRTEVILKKIRGFNSPKLIRNNCFITCFLRDYLITHSDWNKSNSSEVLETSIEKKLKWISKENWREVNQEIGTAYLQDKDCKRFSIMQAF